MKFITLKGQIQSFCLLGLISGCITVNAATQTLQGSGGQVHVPSMYKGKEGVLMCTMEKVGQMTYYVGKITSPTKTLYNVIGSYPNSGSVPELHTSYSQNISSLETGTYTVTAAWTDGSGAVASAGTSGSCYIIVYGIEDENTSTTTTSSEGVTVVVSNNSGDDGLGEVISALLQTITGIQQALSAEDSAIRGEMAQLIANLQSAYQSADAGLRTTLGNQITSLQSILSADIATVRESLETQITNLQSQLNALNANQSSLLSEFNTLKTQLQTAIAANADNIADLSQQLADKYSSLVTANATLKSDLLREIANVTAAYQEADANLAADYTGKIAALQTLLQQSDATLQSNISALNTAYREADAALKENLEEQMETLRATLSADDQDILNQVSALESEMNHALATQKADYESRIEALQASLSAEASALRSEIANLESAYRSETAHLKENLELQIAHLTETTRMTTDSLQNQINETNSRFEAEIAALKSDYDARLATLEGRSDAADQEMRQLIESYAAALRLEMTVADTAIQARLQETLDSLNGTLDTRLQLMLAECDEQIQRVKDQIAARDSEEKIRLTEQKAVLQEQWNRETADIQAQYEAKLADADLSDAERNAVEKEWTEKLAGTNVRYQRQITELENQLREYGDKSIAELNEEFVKLQTERSIIESALNSTDFNDKILALETSKDSRDKEQRLAWEEQLEKLRKQLEALESIGEMTIEYLIARIEAGNTANEAELAKLRLAFEAYCADLRAKLSAKIESLEKTVIELQKLLSARISTLEDRLKYTLMTEEALAAEEENKQLRLNALANQIASLQLVISDKTARGEDVSREQAELNSLLMQYDEAETDLENIRLAIELRANSEFALHKKWILELQELTKGLQHTIDTQAETIAGQKEEIEALKTALANLEAALRNEMALLKQELKEYTDINANELRGTLADLSAQLATLHDNVMTLATSSYSSYGSSSTGNNNYQYSGASNKDIITDDRDLRTSDVTQIDF